VYAVQVANDRLRRVPGDPEHERVDCHERAADRLSHWRQHLSRSAAGTGNCLPSTPTETARRTPTSSGRTSAAITFSSANGSPTGAEAARRFRRNLSSSPSVGATARTSPAAR
jgi:hypothetical protein